MVEDVLSKYLVPLIIIGTLILLALVAALIICCCWGKSRKQNLTLEDEENGSSEDAREFKQQIQGSPIKREVSAEVHYKVKPLCPKPIIM